MSKISRREFVQGLGAFAMLPLARTEPDLILYNGTCWTVGPDLPKAQIFNPCLSASSFMSKHLRFQSYGSART
jgi:hypothetical protein